MKLKKIIRMGFILILESDNLKIIFQEKLL